MDLNDKIFSSDDERDFSGFGEITDADGSGTESDEIIAPVRRRMKMSDGK